MVGVDTGAANKIVAEALLEGRIGELADYAGIRAEVKYGQASRVDFLLTQAGLPDAYVEVKSVTLSRVPGLAEFPDSVTARGAKHLQELAEMVRQGHRSVMLFLIQRTDSDRLDVAADIDPKYAQALAEARAQGVEVIAYDCAISPTESRLRHAIPIPAGQS
jgi:sugar fermentation stimulation protein A